MTRDEWMDNAENIIHDLMFVAHELANTPEDPVVLKMYERVWLRARAVLDARPRRSKRHSITRQNVSSE